MSNEEMHHERAFARDLLVALEVGTKKEDKALTDCILSRHNITRPRSRSRRGLIDKLSNTIIAGPGFEAFFLDVAQSIRPFALMLQDVFAFLAKHAATTERRSSSVRVSHRGAAQAFDFDLSGFPKEALEVVTRVRGRNEILRLTPQAKADVLRDTWQQSNCWKVVRPNWDGDFYDDGFYRVLSYANTILNRGEWDREAMARLVGPVIDRLAALAQIHTWPELFPDQSDDQHEDISYMDDESKTLRWSFPTSRSSTLDREDTVRALHAEGSTDSNRDLPYLLVGIARAVSLWNQEDFRRQDHRDWLSNRLGIPFENITVRDYEPLLKEETEKITAALEELIVVHRIESVEAELRVVIDFLRLPFWRDRWFLYELWTVAHVLGIGAPAWSLRLLGLIPRSDGGVEWLLPGGVAKEPIAVFEGGTAAVECWSQRKTFHPETAKGLEPDLRLTRSSERHEDLVVIENKDRIKPSRGGIEEILTRYVTGTQAKAVWIVNYEEFTGPTHALGRRWSERLVFIESQFRPGDVSERFSRCLLQILGEELGPADMAEDSTPETPAASSAISVTLIWENPPQDLDLHAWSRGERLLEHICFSNRGQLGRPPWLQLDKDCQQSPGREELVIDRVLGDEVEIAIHQYSEDGQLETSQASVAIQQLGHGVTRLVPPETCSGRWWRICTFKSDSSLVIRNVVTTEEPGERGWS